MIGVVGGVGPYAGVDLVSKILGQTVATCDQDHVPLALISLPSEIPDRTRFLLGLERRNPADSIARVLRKLEDVGVTVAGIACNTSHAEPIFEKVREALAAQGSRLTVLDMVEEAARSLAERIPEGSRVGVLSTMGTHRLGIYARVLTEHHYELAALSDAEMEELVHNSIYHPDWGLKVCPSPVSLDAKTRLYEAARLLEQRGAQAVVLGCTELPFAFPNDVVGRMSVVDPTLAFARALIREAFPERLRPHAGLGPAHLEHSSIEAPRIYPRAPLDAQGG